MTREAVVRVVQRAISDGAFRTQLTKDASTALRGFDLTPAEVAAIRSGDSGRISAFGVDLRMSKAFGLAAADGSRDGVLTTGTDSSLASGVNSGVNSTMTSGVDSSGASTVNSSLTSGFRAGSPDSSNASSVNSSHTSGADSSGASTIHSSLTSGADSSMQTGVNSSATIDQGAMGSADATIGENAGHQVVQWDGNDDAPLSTLIPGEPAHAFGADTPEGGAFGQNTLTAGDEGYLPSVNFASTSEGGASAESAGFATDEGQLTNSLNADASQGGASSPTEAGDGPNITP